MLLSDHSPLLIYLVISPGFTGFKKWRFNVFLLPDREISNYIFDILQSGITMDLIIIFAGRCFIS
jgi:hypothetical protein